MKDTLFVLETARHTFISMEQVGNQELDVIETEHYFTAQIYDSKDEIDAIEELINTGKSSHLHLRSDWQISIDSELLPVRKRTIQSELMEA